MLMTDQHPHNKSIMVSVLGVPNVGKSSLINYLLGMDLTIVSPRAQTTRNKINCVFTVDRTEIVMVDTPGLHVSGQEMNKRMNQLAREGTQGSDLNLILIDLTREVIPQFQEIKKLLGDVQLGPVWVVFTKADLIPGSETLPLSMVIEKVKEEFPSIERHFSISSKTGDNVHELTGALVDRAQPGPHLYPNGEVSDKNERFFVSEYIREQAFDLLKDELPYEMAVVVEDFKDFRDKKDTHDPSKVLSHIAATIIVNRPSQRAIVVGTKGGMIKEIGTRSRQKIESMIGGKINLNLHVKVAPKWFKNNMILEQLGLYRSNDSARVWKAKA
ncbi:MAG: GTPase Era [Bdellovibrio sp.]